MNGHESKGFVRVMGLASHSRLGRLFMTEADIVEGVVGAAYEVANVLGAGFLEKVYERAITRELVI